MQPVPLIELYVQITFGKSDTFLLPADTDTIQIRVTGEDGREWKSEALPPEFSIPVNLWEDGSRGDQRTTTPENGSNNSTA